MTERAPNGVEGRRRRISSLLRGPTHTIDQERLDGALVQLGVRLERMDEAELTPAGGSWKKAAGDYLTKARVHRDRGELNASWSAVSAADRCLVGTLDTDALLIEGARVQAEAGKKLEGWRRGAEESFWPEEADQERWRAKPDPADLGRVRLEVMEVRRLIDESADNLYWKQEYQRVQMVRSAQAVFLMLLTTVVVMAIVLANGWQIDSESGLLEDLSSFVVVVTLGGLGASLSGLVTVSQRDLSQSIPEIRAQWTLIRFRPIIGAASAIGVVAILQSGIGGLSIAPEASVVAAFLAGFSERIVSGAVARAGASLTE